MVVRDEVRKMKSVAPLVAAMSNEARCKALEKVAEKLVEKQDAIFAENKKDLDAAAENGVADAVVKRLKFNEGKLKDVVAGIKQLITLEDPIGKVTLDREMDEGLRLTRITCPIGVIGVIFEARPDALVQISSLCIRSGNCPVLKGGKETTFTNRILFEIIYGAVLETGFPEGCMLQVEQHNEIDELLTCDGLVDLLIPRGSNAFVRYIMDNTHIPVMGHADGVCHIYVDKDADIEKAIPIIIDAKTQYTAACNAVETLLIQRDENLIGRLMPRLTAALAENGIKLRGTQEVTDVVDRVVGENSGESTEGKTLEYESISEDEFKEYLALIVSAKFVDNVDEAIEHINLHGSHHTDAIITENDETATRFMQLVDSAGVYQNCSTRFADGFRYGFGAEVGISTSKIHARGPVGLEGLVTYKYKIVGHGQIVGDYASGKSEFHFKDL
ncbi:MAG: glutamate-5-semialdehyde dehydrogenase [Eubacterium sp.]|nr:glutamate-5-semialdehyde dehydrogenase [Eubacterium sp.]MBR1773282.1 glutamate-5-semialdehyde dehydrogenase [Eubacterium sp.]